MATQKGWDNEAAYGRLIGAAKAGGTMEGFPVSEDRDPRFSVARTAAVLKPVVLASELMLVPAVLGN